MPSDPGTYSNEPLPPQIIGFREEDSAGFRRDTTRRLGHEEEDRMPQRKGYSKIYDIHFPTTTKIFEVKKNRHKFPQLFNIYEYVTRLRMWSISAGSACSKRWTVNPTR